MRRASILALGAVLVACYGGVSDWDTSGGASADAGADGADGDGGGADDDGGHPGGVDCVDAPAGVAAPLRRLGRLEYLGVIEHLLGLDAAAFGDLPPDERAGTFVSNSISPIDALSVDRYRELAEALAAQAVTDVAGLTGCEAQPADPQACAAQFVATFGRRAYRRPLTAQEQATYLAVYDASRANADHVAGIETVVQTMLQSPHLMYHVETDGQPGANGETRILSDHTVASRLAFFLWRAPPDDALLDAAERGDLSTADGLRAQALRLLDSPRARVAIADFHRQWLAIDDLENSFKDPDLFPAFTPALVAQMVEETEAFADHVIRSQDGDLQTLLGADFTIAGPDLLDLYGVDAALVDGDGIAPLDASQRAGLLTHASVMAATSHANQTSPIFRGVFIRENLLCDVLPPVPPDVDNTPPELKPGATTRERFEEHRDNPACAGCHVMIDPIGFTFEHYDAVGRFRATEDGLEIDASGEVVGIEELAGEFGDALELTARLADSSTVRACFAAQWFRFGLGRGAMDTDECATAELTAAFEDAGGEVKGLMLALVTSDAFRIKALAEGESP